MMGGGGGRRQEAGQTWVELGQSLRGLGFKAEASHLCPGTALTQHSTLAASHIILEGLTAGNCSK